MRIRSATTAEVESIIHLHRLFYAGHLGWDSARWTTKTPPGAMYSGWIDRLGKSNDGLALVAELDSRIIGYLIAEVEPESTLHWSPAAVYLHDLFVDPVHRRAGIARELMNHLLQWSATQHPRLQLRLITAVRNDAARTFFERFGFRSCAVEMIRE